jgi:hypothetical protein
MTQPGILKVTETAKQDIEAIAAYLHMAVEGESFIYGNAALQKCKEIKTLVEHLKSIGIDDADIVVVGVKVAVTSGLFGKNSKATYRLRVYIQDLAKLPEALGAISAAKNISLEQLQWKYDDEAAVAALTNLAVQKAHQKAVGMMQSIGYQILGIRACADSVDLPKTNLDLHLYAAEPAGELAVMQMRRRSSTSTMPTDIGTEFKSTKEIKVTVSAEFWVGSPQQNQSPLSTLEPIDASEDSIFHPS